MNRSAEHPELQSLTSYHPRCPAAAGIFDWSANGLGHPDAPAARYADWGFLPHPDSPTGRFMSTGAGRAALEISADEPAKVARLAAEETLAEQTKNLRAILPDHGLQVIWDRQIEFLKEAYEFSRSFAVIEPPQVLLHAQRQIGWIDCHLQRVLPASYQRTASPILEQVLALRAQSIFGDQEELYGNLETLTVIFCRAATKGIQEQLAEVSKTGKQQEFFARWRGRMQACGAQASGGVVEAPPEPPSPAKKPPSEEAVKTWIAIQMVDEDGNPVPNLAYEVTLPDGSLMTGSLNDQGMARFDEIDPGQCKVSFPEIHAKEWKQL